MLLLSLLIFLTSPFIYLFEYLIAFPVGLFVVFLFLLIYKHFKKLSYYELDRVFLATKFPVNFILSFGTGSHELMPAGGVKNL